jgi:hypothetical protein
VRVVVGLSAWLVACAAFPADTDSTPKYGERLGGAPTRQAAHDGADGINAGGSPLYAELDCTTPERFFVVETSGAPDPIPLNILVATARGGAQSTIDATVINEHDAALAHDTFVVGPRGGRDTGTVLRVARPTDGSSMYLRLRVSSPCQRVTFRLRTNQPALGY